MKYKRILRIFGAALILSLLMAVIPAAPALAFDYDVSLSPTQGKIGDTITITGSDFSPSTETNEKRARLIFTTGNVSTGTLIDNIATYKILKDTLIGFTDDADEGEFSTTFAVPSSLTDGNTDQDVNQGTYLVCTAVVSTTVSTIKSVSTFTVTPGATLDPLSPASGPAGTQVQITGANFPANATLVIKYDDVPIAITSGDTVTKSSGIIISTITIPSSSTTGAHTITITAGTSTVTKTFTVTASATLDPLQPTSGAVGTSVAVSGASFPASTAIVFKFDTTTITPASGDTATRPSGIFASTITIPQSTAGAHTITVTAGSGSATANFTVTGTGTGSTLSPLSPASGLAGTNVTVSGSNFPASTALSFKYDAATLTPSGSTQTDATGNFTSIVTVPSGVTKGAHTITVTAGSSTATAVFTVTETPPPPPPSATSGSLSPASTGSVGAQVIISGTGFKAGAKATVKYDDSEVSTATITAQGILIAAFSVPTSKAGPHNIVANEGTNTLKLTFTVESTPPKIPQPVKPEMGIEVKAPITFDWGDVTDNSSPVTYDLQVASASDFAPSSLILDKTAIAKSEYSLTEAEELKLAGQTSRLFWRIKAVDAASNESDWTGAGDFSVAQPFKFTGWVLYLTIGVSVVLIFLFGFWMGRRTAFYY